MNILTSGTKPYLIGITGSIGSGKSLVRKMLEHLGALTIDADELAHHAYEPGSPGYDAVIKRFGSQVLDDQARIDRSSLGRLVFQDERGLKDLENIVHPLVVKAVNNILEFTPMPIVAVEAIKLIESGLGDMCGTIWINDAPRQSILDRLEQSRGMNKKEVVEILDQQAHFSSFRDKRITRIANDSDRIHLWNEICSLWDNLVVESRQFRESYEWTRETYESFYMPLIQLSVNAAQDLKGQFAGAESAEDTFGFLCTHFVWETVPVLSGRNFVVSLMRNRIMHILSISDQIDDQQFPMLFKMIEDFSTLHLCTRIVVPFYEEFKTVFPEIGYDRYTNSNMGVIESLPLSNGFYKVLLPEINYFKDSG